MDRTSVRLSRGDGLLAVVRAVGAKIRKGVAGTGLFAVIGCNYMTKVVVA
jgi:hypothetical protein